MLVRLGGWGHRALGISAIKELMEVVHTSVKVGSCLLAVQIKTNITVSISEGGL